MLIGPDFSAGGQRGKSRRDIMQVGQAAKIDAQRVGQVGMVYQERLLILWLSALLRSEESVQHIGQALPLLGGELRQFRRRFSPQRNGSRAAHWPPSYSWRNFSIARSQSIRTAPGLRSLRWATSSKDKPCKLRSTITSR